MKLCELLVGLNPLEMNVNTDMEITHVTSDSRKVQAGGLFVAVSGFAADGNRFIPMAMSKGATVVVTAKKPQEDIPYVCAVSVSCCRTSSALASPVWTV